MPDQNALLRDRKKARTRHALIEHAVILFDTVGFEATTVDDIVAAVGCSQRTFFRHFAAKEDVVFHDLPERLAELTELLDTVGEDASPWHTVRDSMRRLTRQFTDENPRLTEVRIRLWMTEPLLYARWAELSMDWERVLTRYLVARGGSGTGFDIEAEVIAAALVAGLRAAWRGEVLHGGRFDELVDRALAVLDRGFDEYDRTERTLD